VQSILAQGVHLPGLVSALEAGEAMTFGRDVQRYSWQGAEKMGGSGTLTIQTIIKELPRDDLVCSRGLFGLLNRVLNQYGYHAVVNALGDDTVSFRVVDNGETGKANR
jgi:hypothetical protein